ncbi:MAG: sigma-54-dependent Fis family transcriptional regulator [candidate division Zixibacteria bacterium]|nr:sigma-54-dependent Fis family transcriptional regulator [candidate division Zixibacteria bacterium]
MSNLYGNILVVDDNEDILLAARLFLRKYVNTVYTEKNPDCIPDLLRNNSYDVILLDMNFTKDVSSGQEGFDWLNKILEIDPSAVVVLITAYGDVEMAVRAIKEGAIDFVLKPWQNEKLWATVSSAMNLRKIRLEADGLRQRQKQLSDDIDQPYHDFIGDSPAMQKVFDIIEKVAGTDANVLILGENGTGKELVAREIHRQSKRSSEVFINVDVGAIHENLFESELFGHVKGAFTDAKENRAGRFEVASGGSLFLDEIGNVPLSLQAKLLAVLQNREVTRIGSNKAIPVDIRLICATNKPILKMTVEDNFRQDLLYRINTVEINLPPLRERKEDIALLAEHFLTKYASKYSKPINKISSSALKALSRYDWPGNVRELEHAVERAVIMCGEKVLRPENILLAPKDISRDKLTLDDYNLEHAEKIIILKAINKHNGNVSHAAKELGLTRASLYRRMQKYGL